MLIESLTELNRSVLATVGKTTDANAHLQVKKRRTRIRSLPRLKLFLCIATKEKYVLRLGAFSTYHKRAQKTLLIDHL